MRRILLGVAFAILALILTVISLFFILRGGFGSRKILEYAQSFLKSRMHTEITYSEGQIDFMKGMHFRNLKIIKDDESMQASIEIPQLDLSYDIAVLRKRLEIFQFVMKDAKISVVQHVKASTGQVSTSEKPTESMRAKLERFILNPPAEVVIDQVSIENTELHAEVRGPEVEGAVLSNSAGAAVAVNYKQVDLHQFNFHFKMEMVQERLAASGDLSMAPRNQVTMTGVSTKAPNSTSPTNPPTEAGATETPVSMVSQLETAFSSGGQWSVDIHREGKGWLYRFETNNLKFALNDLYMGDPKPALAAAAIVDKTAASRVGPKSTRAADKRSAFTSFEHAEFTLESNSLLHSAQLFQIDQSSIETMKVSLIGKTSEVTKKDLAGTTLVGPQTISFTTLLANDLDFDLLLDSAKIQKPPTIPRAVSLKVKAHGSVPRTLDHLLINSQVELAGQKMLDSKFELDRKEKDLDFKGRGKLTLSMMQAKAIAAANKFTAGLGLDFEVTGHRTAVGDVEASFKTKIPNLVMAPLPKSSKVDVEATVKWQASAKAVAFDGQVGFVNPIQGGWLISPHLRASLEGPMRVKGTADVAQTQRPAPTGPPLILGQPLHAEYDVDLGGEGHANMLVKLPAAEVPGQASLDGTELHLNVRSPDLKSAQDLKIDFDVKQAGMKLAETYAAKLPPKSPPFKDLAAKGKLQLTDKRRFVLENMTFSLNGGEVAIDAQASGDLQEKTLQSVANVSIQMRDDFPEFNGQKLRGRIKVPITITVLRARQVSLNGEMDLDGVSWKKGDLSASGINGKIPFSEKLNWDGMNIRFASLVTQNPFERVDFDRVRPLLQGSERLRIDKIGWFEKSYGPMVGFFSVEQNMIFAHQFDMDLVSGKLYGEMFINTYPQSLQYGLLARMTGLDLGEILPKKFLARVPSGSKSLSGRAGFVLNLNRNTMDGRIDVTEIGGSQLITAINVVDPVYADEKMNKVRRLLEVGYPTSVELSFADGYMDMDLGLTVLGVSSRQNIHGVRISSMLQKATSGFMETAEKGPLK